MVKPQLFPLLALALILAAFCVPRAALAQETQSYVVQKGDTANSIARQFYGKSSLGPSLWRANKALVAHPNRLTPGDTIYIFPESTLALKKPIQVPPPPEADPTDLYERNQPLQMAFPKYFSFAADPRGQGGTGLTRIRVKKIAPLTGEEVDELYEVHLVGELIGSSDRGSVTSHDGYDLTAPGRLLLSTGDNVMVRFTADLARLRDSDTYDDPDPYFSTFPIYSLDDFIREPERSRPDYRQPLGQLFHYKGRLTIVSRVEGLIPSSAGANARNKRTPTAGDSEPVSYVGRITYSEDAINLNDKLLLFVPTDPGPERRLDSPYVEPPGAYVSPGK
ncbi:MAG: LysM peptidoglycan-binding domain-containing protein [Deltaproteobacteria bacterium]|jgi:hypothetical protein|nr:LysM peptidoglycan-binding domain-containing protein [Deltaproteobacteria bacterium]